MKYRILVPVIVSVMVIATACNLPSNTPSTDFDQVATFAAQTVEASIKEAGQPTATLEIQLQSPQPPADQPASTLELQSQAPPTSPPSQQQPTITNTPLPCNRASFVQDVTVPDNTAFAVNKSFTKTWRLKNVGTCTWTSGYQVVFDSGDKMGGPDSQQLTTGTVASGQTIDVSLNLVAPSSPGTYKGNWKLKDSNGQVFALSTGPFWVQIKATAAADWPTFKKGDTGMEVFAIQYLLLHHGQTPGVDGIFGPETQNEVEDFQTQKNLSEDGIVGPETWQALIVQIKQGSNGDAVRAAQQLLRGKYNYPIAVDGAFGPATAQAVKDFQASKGITSDGIVGPITWQKLIGN